MSITKDTIVGELVALDYRTATVFKKHGIDFCCNGNRSIESACVDDKASVDSLISTLKEVTTVNDNSSIDYTAWPLDLLADYVEKKHHRYVQEKSVEIMPYLEKIVRVHGGRHPELIQVEELFKASVGELTQHMKKEELVLFPIIRKMVNANGAAVETSFGSVGNPIRAMMEEHDNEGERFRQISKLTNDYTPPADACGTYRVTFALLKEFEDDLHLHIHIENNILFPKSIELEEKLA